MMEGAGQAGIAHFLEHMAFRGSAHIKDGEVFRRMERLGAAPGADTNAYTGYDETVYQFNLPKNDKASIDEAFLLLRDIAGELKIDGKAVAVERNVILSEERLGDSPGRRLYDRFMHFAYRGLVVSDHMTIGHVADIEKVTDAQIRGFYRRWYRPANAALVITGDIDPDKVVAEIRRRFAGWKGQGAAPPELDRGKVTSRPAESDAYAETGLTTSMSVSWLSPADPAARDDAAQRRTWLIRTAALGVFNRRLVDLAQGSDAPFLNASVSASTGSFKTADVSTLHVATGNETWERGLRTLVGEWRKALRDGFTQAEIDRQILLMRRNHETARDGAGTRRTPNLANGLLNSYGSENVFRSPAQSMDLFEAQVGAATKAEIDDSFRALFAKSQPLFFAASPTPIEGLNDAYAGIMAAPAPEAPPPEAEKTWTYTDFGPAGQIVERHEEADLGATFVTFANGVRLTVKPTRFADDQILVAATLGDGMVGQPKTGYRLDFLSPALLQGGLKDLTLPDIQKVMAGKVAGLGFSIEEGRFLLSGNARPKDFDTLMQRMAAQVVAPGWRPEGLEQTKSRYKPWIAALDTTLGGAMLHHSSEFFMNGDARWAVPSEEQMAGTSLDTIHAWFDRALAEDYLEVVVVGRVETDQAIAAVAGTLGALPPRKPYRPLPQEEVAVSLSHSSAPFLIHHRGRADQAFEQIVWPTLDRRSAGPLFYDLQLAGSIVSQRLFDQFREKVGATYTPGALSSMSLVFPSYGYFAAYTETPPDKFPLFEQMLSSILDDLKARPVGKDEFERARKPLIERGKEARQTNGYWVSALQDAQADPFRLEMIRKNDPDSWNAETPEAVQKAIQTYLTDDKELRVRVTAE